MGAIDSPCSDPEGFSTLAMVRKNVMNAIFPASSSFQNPQHSTPRDASSFDHSSRDFIVNFNFAMNGTIAPVFVRKFGVASPATNVKDGALTFGTVKKRLRFFIGHTPFFAAAISSGVKDARP
jgi:hypothetical protein